MYRPRSVLTFILLGYALVALPLIVALVNTSLSMERLAGQGQRAILQAVEATRDTQRLTQHLVSLERYARQYGILGDRAILEVYDKQHRDFSSAANRLGELLQNEKLGSQVKKLQDQERSVYRRLMTGDGPPDEQEMQRILENFNTMNGLIWEVHFASGQMVAQEVDALEERVDSTRVFLLWQAGLVVSAALLLIVVFAVLLVRPIRQMGQAIRRVGDGDFRNPIPFIKGPQELEELNEHLSWLAGRLGELERQKAQFLQHVSHELKTPLTAIREGTELLSEEVAGPLNDRQRDVARIVRQNGLALQGLIEHLLRFNQAEAHLSATQTQPVDLPALCRQVVEDHRLALEAKGVEVASVLQPVTVTGDPDKLRVVIDNLMSNAVKYSPRGGCVTLRCGRQDGDVFLEVTDEGPGFDPEDLGHVFEPFYQGRRKAGGHVKGTGLGLAIASEYVQRHGGTIQAERGRTRGARMVVCLPQRAGGGALEA